MKKVLTILMALAIMLTCVSIGSVQAADLDENATYVPAFSFDFFEDGFELGGLDDNGKDGESKYVNCQQTVGIYFDTTVTTEGAFYGKAMKFTGINGGKDGVYVPISMAIKQADPARTNFEGATDFVCYIDTRDWGSQRGIRPVITVNGEDQTGELTGATNTYFPGDDKPAYVQDASKNWVAVEKVTSGTIDLAENYVGWIRVPLSSFVQTDWDAEDVNGKLDLKEVVTIAAEVGCYDKNDGHSIIIDEIGFLGDFKDGVNQSFLKDGKIADANATSGTSGASTATSGASNASKGGLTTTTWILIAAGAIVVIAVVIILVVILSSKKKGQKDEGASADQIEAGDKPEPPADDASGSKE